MTIHYTKKKAKHGGVYGNRGLFFHCIRIHFDRCGFGVYAMNTKGRLSNCQITRSTKSGVISYKNSTIEIEGEDTTIQHNVVDGSSDSYGLKTFHSSSFIHLLSPLTKELVSFDNDRTKRPNPKQRKKFLKAQKKEKGEAFEFDRNDFVDYDSPLQTLKGKNWGCGSGSNCSTPAKPIASSAREDLEKLTIEELRKRLKNRGLNQKGKQKVLVSRLRVAVNAGNEIVENILTVLKWDSVEEAQRKDAIAAQMGVDKDQILFVLPSEPNSIVNAITFSNDKQLSHLYLEPGIHVVKGSGYVVIRKPITIYGAGRGITIVKGAFKIKGKKVVDEKVTLAGMTVQDEHHYGLYAYNCLFFHCDRVHFDQCGCGVAVGNTNGKLSNCQITESKLSGVLIEKHSHVEIDGVETKIEMNGTVGGRHWYGLKAETPTSFVHLRLPLTLTMIAVNNYSGGNWKMNRHRNKRSLIEDGDAGMKKYVSTPADDVIVVGSVLDSKQEFERKEGIARMLGVEIGEIIFVMPGPNSIARALNQMTANKQFIQHIYLEAGTHVVIGDYLLIEQPMTITGAGRGFTFVQGGGFKIQGVENKDIDNDVHVYETKDCNDLMEMKTSLTYPVILRDMTVHETTECGLYGDSGMFFHCARMHFDHCGRYGVGLISTKGKLTNCQVTSSTLSGIASYKQSVIEIDGKETQIEHNVTSGSDNHYELKAYHSSSSIYLLPPLTKDCVVPGSGGGGAFGIEIGLDSSDVTMEDNISSVGEKKEEVGGGGGAASAKDTTAASLHVLKKTMTYNSSSFVHSLGSRTKKADDMKVEVDDSTKEKKQEEDSYTFFYQVKKKKKKKKKKMKQIPEIDMEKLFD